MTAHIQYPKILHPLNLVGLEFLVDTSWLLGIPQTIVVAIKSSERLNLWGAECESNPVNLDFVKRAFIEITENLSPKIGMG